MFAKEVYLKMTDQGLLELPADLEDEKNGTEVALYRFVLSGTVEHKTVFTAKKRPYKKQSSASSKGDYVEVCAVCEEPLT